MASPYVLTNGDLQYLNCTGQDFSIYMAFLNPVSITTQWANLNLDSSGNWQPPPNFDTCFNHVQPYAPTVCMGGNRIGFVGEPLYFDGSRSYQRFDLPCFNYTWTYSGSPSVTNYANGSQIEVTWSSPGIYTVTLTVSDRVNTRAMGTRQIMIYQDRTSTLPGLISVSGLDGSLSSGGWQFQCETVNTQASLLNADTLSAGTYQPIVLMIETRFEVQPGIWVNRTIGPHGLFNPGYPYCDPRIFFDGYIQSGTVHQDIDKDTLSFSCVGPQMILQEAKTHQLGYYNCAYSGYTWNGIPTGCKTSPVGNGYQVGGLMTADVVHSLLQSHCNIGNFHDIHIWNANIPTQPYQPNVQPAAYNLIYTTLSVNEGTIWQNIQDLVTNEFAQSYCERDGSIRIGPQVNYQGGDYWSMPTLLGPQAAPYLLNLVQDLGYTTSNTPSKITQSIPILPAQPMPITFVHPWGAHPTPPQFLKPFAGGKNASIVAAQTGLLGPPVLCTFSDTPIYDNAASPPDVNILYPWIVNNWPQDLAVYPISFDIQENYTGRASLIKLIGTLYGHSSLWSSWYPVNTFQTQGNGTVSVVVTNLPASDWVVNESHVLADITTGQQQQLCWLWWWEVAKREYYAHNLNYQGTITTSLFTPVQLGDIIGITRQNNTLGPSWSNKLFVVTEISHSIDLTQRTWQTTLTISEVTSVYAGSISSPPTSPPSG